MKLLGSGYPWEVVIFDALKGEAFSEYVDELGAIKLKEQLNRGDTRFVDIGGNTYFWSDIRKLGRVTVPLWLDTLIFRDIQKQENRMKVLREIARRAKISTKFRDEEDVYNFLSLNS